jgi:O-acetyl-ADP-ribose deacetylase (regulator of RNase III)
MVQLYLVDVNPALVAAWKTFFEPFPQVIIRQGDILAAAHNAVASPANCLGFMDGGIDQVYADFFGAHVEDKVREAIARRPEGHLPVGAAVAVKTGHRRVPLLVVAPTMLLPEAVGEDTCYRAFRAVLRLAGQHRELGKAVYCPGLATGVGGVSPSDAAREMARAYADWVANPPADSSD